MAMYEGTGTSGRVYTNTQANKDAKKVPVEVKPSRSQALALRWIMDATRKRKNKTMAEKLYAEILDASQNKGSAIKKREDTHKMAESNKAFAHFRW